MFFFEGLKKKLCGCGEGGRFLIQGLSDDEFSSDIPGMFYYNTCFICTKKALAIVIQGLGLIFFFTILSDILLFKLYYNSNVILIVNKHRLQHIACIRC